MAIEWNVANENGATLFDFPQLNTNKVDAILHYNVLHIPVCNARQGYHNSY